MGLARHSFECRSMAFFEGRETVVVFGRYHHESIRLGYTMGHGTRVESGLGEIDDVDAQVLAQGNFGGEPGRHGRSKAALAGATNDDGQRDGVASHLLPIGKTSGNLKSRTC